MRKRWIVTLGMLALALAIGGWAEAAENECNNPNPGELRVSVAVSATAANIGLNDYDNPNCHLIIDQDIQAAASNTSLLLRASDITITGAEIRNDDAAGEIRLIAQHTDINITNSRVKAHKLLSIICNGINPPCDLNVSGSELVATFDFANPGPGSGDLKIVVKGDINIQTSTVHGGARTEMTATFGGITLLCGPVGGGCQDPFVSSTAATLCDKNPPPGAGLEDFPCSVTFQTREDLRGVCFPVSEGQCDGGSVEKRFTACLDINITGSTITSVEHMTFETKGIKQDGTKCDGGLLASGANLSSSIDSVVINIVGNGTSPSIDLSDAAINAFTHATITAQGPATGAATGCPDKTAAYPANVCINANGAAIQASNIIMTAASNNGVIDLCGTVAPNPALASTRPPQAAGVTAINDLGADFPTFNGDTTPAFSHVDGALVETVLNGAVECGALSLFPATIDSTIDP
jgi:hypothetical protein